MPTHIFLLLLLLIFYLYYIYTLKQFDKTGGLYLVSCGSNITRLPTNNIKRPQEIAVNGSSMTVGSKLQSLCDFSSLEHFKRLHIAKLSINETVVSTTYPSAPK